MCVGCINFKERFTFQRIEIFDDYFECCCAHFTYHLRFKVSISGTDTDIFEGCTWGRQGLLKNANENSGCFEKVIYLDSLYIACSHNRENASLNQRVSIITIIAFDENFNLNNPFILYTKMRKVRKLSGMMMILIETMHKQLFLLEAINLRCKCWNFEHTKIQN